MNSPSARSRPTPLRTNIRTSSARPTSPRTDIRTPSTDRPHHVQTSGHLPRPADAHESSAGRLAVLAARRRSEDRTCGHTGHRLRRTQPRRAKQAKPGRLMIPHGSSTNRPPHLPTRTACSRRAATTKDSAGRSSNPQKQKSFMQESQLGQLAVPHWMTQYDVPIPEQAKSAGNGGTGQSATVAHVWVQTPDRAVELASTHW